MMWKRARRSAITIEGEHRSAVFMAHSRLSFLAVCFVFCYLLVMVRLFDLAMVQGSDNGYNTVNFAIEKEQEVKSLAARRGDIYDSNGMLLATTLKTPSLFIDPSLVLDKGALISDIVNIIPDLNRNKIVSIMRSKSRFGWVARGITPEQQRLVLDLGEPSLGFKYEYSRIYPQGSLFSHLVGYTDRDGLGLSGVERSYDDVLSSGTDVNLTLDLRLQHIVKRELSKAMSDFSAKGGSGIILDAHSGEVLAGVSLPDFDLNEAGKAKDDQRFNRLSLGVYELGSMFKIFSTAALLELHDVGMGKTFDARKPLKVGRFRIRDYHAQNRMLNIAEIFMYSSNIGSALIGEMIGGDALKGFYADLGLLDPLRFDIKEIGKPLVPDVWRRSTIMTVSYGHGLAVSPLQMSAAVASIINGGMAVQPSLVSAKDDNIKTEMRIISKKTSEDMRKLLRLAVTNGTGKNSDVVGYEIGGKTGTAEKSVGGKYSRKSLISSFVGAFPMDDPRYVLMVMVDEPKPNEHSYGYATAGWVAAPAVARIVTSMASVLGIPADKYDASKDMAASLLPYVEKKNKGGKHLVSY